jgi:2Fe-2S iron-sulfur cluster binding domain
MYDDRSALSSPHFRNGGAHAGAAAGRGMWGNLACGTCRVVVDAAWASRLNPPDKLESDLLEYAPELNERSRLSCQIKADSSLDGLIVHVPASQR